VLEDTEAEECVVLEDAEVEGECVVVLEGPHLYSIRQTVQSMARSQDLVFEIPDILQGRNKRMQKSFPNKKMPYFLCSWCRC
jgi:hypothetical protein